MSCSLVHCRCLILDLFQAAVSVPRSAGAVSGIVSLVLWCNMVEHCKNSCPGGATAYLGGYHCLSSGSHSDDKASLSSSETLLE